MMHYRPHRYQTHFPIQLHTPAGTQKGEVIDVNNNGARITGLGNVRAGDRIQIDAICHRIEAVIRWTSEEGAGIAFRPQITDNQLDTLRYRPDGRKTVSRCSVGFGIAELR